ncbi:hypothetical protein HYU11_03245 [Candidatus Woesearchaeota archaeon]|nr:hypothetical protein [Candidatus Woesearchaeota archaeon]
MATVDEQIRFLEKEMKGNSPVMDRENAIESKKLQVLNETLFPLLMQAQMLLSHKTDARSKLESARKVANALIGAIASRQDNDLRRLRKSLGVEYMHIRQLPEYREHAEIIYRDISLLNLMLEDLEKQSALLILMENELGKGKVSRILSGESGHPALWKELDTLVRMEAVRLGQLQVDSKLVEKQIGMVFQKLQGNRERKAA